MALIIIEERILNCFCSYVIYSMIVPYVWKHVLCMYGWLRVSVYRSIARERSEELAVGTVVFYQFTQHVTGRVIIIENPFTDSIQRAFKFTIKFPWSFLSTFLFMISVKQGLKHSLKNGKIYRVMLIIEYTVCQLV